MTPYPTLTDAITDLSKAGLHYLGKTIDGASQSHPKAHEIKLLVEGGTAAMPVASYAHQGVIELANGTCYLGATSNRTPGTGICDPVRQYLLIKGVIVADNLTGTAAEVKAAIEAKQVRRPLGSPISWQSLKVAVGVAKWFTFKGVMDAIVAANNQYSPIVADIIASLDPEKRLTVDPATDEYRSQVDAMRMLINAAYTAGGGQGEAFTVDDADKMKALGEQAWTTANNVTVREWMVANILG